MNTGEIARDPYAFCPAFEQGWKQIRQEYLRIQDYLKGYEDKHLYNQGWDLFGLWGIRHSIKSEAYELPLNTKWCPFTANLIRSHVPNNGAVFFSRLSAGTVIKPHRGVRAGSYRMHLGLIVPEGDIGLQVLGYPDPVRWREGQLMIFDDNEEHEAWNHTDQDRVILIVDFFPDK